MGERATHHHPLLLDMKLAPGSRLLSRTSVPLLAALLASGVAGQVTLRASVSSLGEEASFTCEAPSASADGRYVAFQSSATNLVPGDTNSRSDVFVHDFETGATTRVSVSSTGAQANDSSSWPSMSADGRYVAFGSYATNLVPDDTNFWPDIFLHDRETGATTRVSLTSAGEQTTFSSFEPALSADGHFVAFKSAAANLNSIGTNQWEIYLRDLQAGTTLHVSADANGEPCDGENNRPFVSEDGRYVTYSSRATDLVPVDTNNGQDVFLYDRLLGTTTLVSLDSSGGPTSGPGANSLDSRITKDGRYVVFWSSGGGFVDIDSNGHPDVFMRDLQTGSTTRVSEGEGGEQGLSPSKHPFITKDGRYIVFDSWAQNITPGDTANLYDIILKDTLSGLTRRVSLDMNGLDPDGHSNHPTLSQDGRYVFFESGATDLVPTTDNGWVDIYRYGPIPRDPLIDIDLNGSDGPVTIPLGVPATVSIAFDAGDHTGTHFDWWLWAEAPNGTTFWMLANMTWIASPVPISTYQGGTISFPHVPIISGATLPEGTYRIHFALDAPDGVLDETYRDTIEFTVE